MGELVHMIIAPGSSDLETYWIGPLTFQGGIVGLSAGFVGLTFEFGLNIFVGIFLNFLPEQIQCNDIMYIHNYTVSKQIHLLQWVEYL